MRLQQGREGVQIDYVEHLLKRKETLNPFPQLFAATNRLIKHIAPSPMRKGKSNKPLKKGNNAYTWLYSDNIIPTRQGLALNTYARLMQR